MDLDPTSRDRVHRRQPKSGGAVAPATVRCTDPSPGGSGGRGDDAEGSRRLEEARGASCTCWGGLVRRRRGGSTSTGAAATPARLRGRVCARKRGKKARVSAVSRRKRVRARGERIRGCGVAAMSDLDGGSGAACTPSWRCTEEIGAGEREWGCCGVSRGARGGFIARGRSMVVAEHGRRPWRTGEDPPLDLGGGGAGNVATQGLPGSGRGLGAATARGACRGAERGPNLAGAVEFTSAEQRGTGAA